MQPIYPQLEELYTVITKDCFKLYSEKEGKKIKKKYKSKKHNIITIKDKIKELKLFISKSNGKNIKDSEMFQFLSKYIYYMDAFLSEKIIKKIDVQYADEYCLPYIALVCFKFFCDDKIDINELLKFKIDKYDHFQNFISHYKLLEQILIEFEEKVTPLLNNNKSDNNLFIKLIIKFDYDGKFYPKLNENKNEVLESGNFNEIYIESSKENDLNSTKANSDKKESPKNNTNSEEKINYENKIGEIDKDMNSSIKIDLNENLTIKKIGVNYHSLESTNEKSLMRKETENNINENANDEIMELKIELKVLRIKSDFEIIEVRLNSIEIKEYIKNWNIIHSEYINIANKKIEYLEKYYKSLKNIIINLSNPYNLNFWRKISNIILKNIFIILRNNKLIISQKKDYLILAQLKRTFNNIKAEQNNKDDKVQNVYNNKIKNIIDKYENELKPTQNQNTNQNISQAADKVRKFHLIVIYKNKENPDITASLSTDFLFYLKERGNQIDHFDEKLLNYLLFSDLNIIENDEIKQIKIEEEKNISISNSIKNKEEDKKIVTNNNAKKNN